MTNRPSIDTGFFKKGDKVLVALSGGADSVCLVHGLASAARELGIEVGAAHFIHGIRPEAAEAELELVTALCRSLDVPLFVGRGDTPLYARESSMGLEEAARRLRYAFLYETADSEGYDLIATAHNQGDNSETVIFNLVRGSGLLGLRGIPPVSGRVVRPLLNASREEIEAYDRAHGLRYATDATNLDQSYSRNRIRMAVMPALREINSAADRHIMSAGSILRDAEDFMRECAEKALDTERRKGSAPLELLRAGHRALRYHMYAVLMKEAGGSAPDGVHFEALEELVEKGRQSSRIDLGSGLEAAISGVCLEISIMSQYGPPDGELIIGAGERAVWNGWEIELGGERGVAFDPLLLEPPFTVRSRRAGDVIQMDFGHKNIKKYMTERKIPLKTRDRIPLICDNKGVLLLGTLAKDTKRCYKNKGVPFFIYCRRILSDDE